MPSPRPLACRYAALGSSVPGEVLDGFEDAPAWPIVIANIAVSAALRHAVRLLCAVQAYPGKLGQRIVGSRRATLREGHHAGRVSPQPHRGSVAVQVAAHMITAIQVFQQPLMESVESQIKVGPRLTPECTARFDALVSSLAV